MSWGLLLHIGATLMMTGLIWLVQCVHYPLFAQVGVDSFQEYHIRHTQWITPIVGPLMLIELGTALLLAQSTELPIPMWQTWLGLALIVVIWASTALLQIPLHNTLASGLDPVAVSKLVSTNWVRTIAWTLRSVLVLGWLHIALKRLV